MKTNKGKLSREKLGLQYELQLEMRASGLNLVDCGKCGSTFIHRTPQDELECPFCGFTSDPCDFPDHFYQGFEDSGEFNYLD